MKILSIGNSFSQDAHGWLKPVCESAGEEVYAVNLYIGGCPLELHWTNFTENKADYAYEINGEYQKMASIKDTLKEENWDVITLQQASHDSGQPQTYVPYLCDLAAGIREICPDAKLCIQETWAYEVDSDHGEFYRYHNSQREMYTRLRDCYEMAGKLIGADVIPVGDVIQYLREQVPQFDYENGGLSLNRDGFHLSWDYGRYAAALTWYGFLFQKDVHKVTFLPTTEEGIAKEELIGLIKNAVWTVLDQQREK